MDRKYFLRILGITFLSLFLVGVFLSTNLPKRFEGTAQNGSTINKYWQNKPFIDAVDSTVQLLEPIRYRIWKDGFQKWTSVPWVGIGMGNYAFIQKIKREKLHLHNFLYSILIEQGIIGLFLLLATFSYFWQKTREWPARLLLVVFPLTLLFDELSWSYIFPVYLSFILAYLTNKSLDKKPLDA